MMTSNHSEASKMETGILKTSAVLMTLSHDLDDFKPKATAMNQ